MPQGAVLGPFTFLIYINHLTKAVNCNLKLFADDTCLYVTVDDPASSATVLNDNFNNVQQWANQWLVNFNPDKTRSMVFTNKKITHPPLYFDNKVVEDVHQHKHLGLIFNTRLSWKDHVSEIIANVSKLLDVMHKLSRELNRKILETIYETFIRSKLEYCLDSNNSYGENDSNKFIHLNFEEFGVFLPLTNSYTRKKYYFFTSNNSYSQTFFFCL